MLDQLHYGQMERRRHEDNELTSADRRRSPARRRMIVFIAAIQLVLPVALTIADGYLEVLHQRARCLAHRGASDAALSARSPGRHLRDLSFPLARRQCKARRSACARVVERIPSFVSSEVRVAANARSSTPPSAARRPPDQRSSRDSFARPRIKKQTMAYPCGATAPHTDLFITVNRGLDMHLSFKPHHRCGSVR